MFDVGWFSSLKILHICSLLVNVVWSSNHTWWWLFSQSRNMSYELALNFYLWCKLTLNTILSPLTSDRFQSSHWHEEDDVSKWRKHESVKEEERLWTIPMADCPSIRHRQRIRSVAFVLTRWNDRGHWHSRSMISRRKIKRPMCSLF